MASRKEQKEALRREREQREAQAKAAQRRRRLIGYGAGGVFVAVIVAVLVVVLVSGVATGGGDSGTQAGGSSDVLPSGGEVPERGTEDLQQAAEAAGCELSENEASSRDHTADLAEPIEYQQKPPNSGKHFQVAAEDGAYEQAPDVKELVHSLEHGRIIIWFKQSLPEEQRANLKALYDEDTYQMLVAPSEAEMPFEVAATAWGADPMPLGTGYTLGCPKYDEGVFDAIRAFKDEHRSKGPEPVP
jgi:hypothetical protein